MKTFDVKMPKLGESITEGIIVSWSVKIGDVVKEDDTLFDVNTSKVNAEIPSPVAGRVEKILFHEGDTVEVGAVVAVINIGDESQTELSVKNDTREEQPPADPVKETSQVKTEAPWFSPAVLSKAKESGISMEELAAIPGSGLSRRVTKSDIEAYISQKATNTGTGTAGNNPEVGENNEVIHMDMVRRIIADRMVESKRISPHVTSVIEVDVTRLVKWREANKDAFYKKEGVKLTYMPAVTESVAQILKSFPGINSSVDGYNIIQKKQINIGIATSLQDGNLIVPVIKNADLLPINSLAAEIAGLANKARENKLAPGDVEGGSFTITNFGSAKTLFGTPIINQPETAILGVGMIQKKPVVIETDEGDVIAIRHRMYLSLSYDHRIIDGALAGSFLKSVTDYLENWKIQVEKNES